MDIHDELCKKYEMLFRHLDEHAFRLCLGADALSMGYGGASAVARAARVSRTTVHAGMASLRKEMETGLIDHTGIRKPGGGRKENKDKDPELLEDLDKLLDPVTRGDPMVPLRWTAKSTTKLAKELQTKGHKVSQATVWRLLDGLGYTMQSNRKTREGTDHPDRNAQFEHIGATVKEFLERGLPVISVDTKKKEKEKKNKNK